jgi:hypothetical protein
MYDPSNIVTAYPGVPHDHHVLNVDPLVRDLAWWMDTDGQRTLSAHTGTYWWDMHWGIEQYLIQQGVNDTLEVHSMEFPNFTYIEEEIERCQDVVLLLEFWVEAEPGLWIRLDDEYDWPGGEGGHYVTCAGVNSTSRELLFCDPYFDAAEQGWPGHVPVNHTSHLYAPWIHNDTKYVSHDAYWIRQWTTPPDPLSPYPGIPIEEVMMYIPQNMGWPPEYHTFIKAAVITSPLAEHDVAVINMTTWKAGCQPMETIGQGYTTNITVTVENQGGYAETFDVTVYGNASVIGVQPVALNPGENQTLLFVWDTTSWTKEYYILSAVADIVPGETDTADNTMIYGPRVLVTLPGDFDGNRWVQIYDIVRMTFRYNVYWPDPKYDPNVDIIENGHIFIYDVVVAIEYYNEKW